MERPVITLSVGEWAVAHSVGAMRQAVNREAGRKNLKAGGQDPLTTEAIGAFGELAFARWANVYPDLSVHLRAGSFDAVWRGYNIDVKTTRTAGGPLYVDERKQPDIYVLAELRDIDVTLVGYISTQKAVRVAYDGKVAQRYLTPMSNLPPFKPGHDESA
jgi:hypothetical protein